MPKHHHYQLSLKWTGNRGEGTSSYQAYSRNYTITINHKPELLGSSDPAFRGDPTRYNPEELLLASIASCHQLWYLHLCADAKVVVLDYQDQATAVMEETANGGGRFIEACLNPVVTVADPEMIPKALELHQKANDLCFIANSVNFPIRHQAVCVTQEA